MSMQSIYLILSGSGLIYLAYLDTYGLYIAILWVIAAFYKPLSYRPEKIVYVYSVLTACCNKISTNIKNNSKAL